MKTEALLEKIDELLTVGQTWGCIDVKTLTALRIAVKTLEECTYGDLASEAGIYKAEIAREALEEIGKIMGEG